ncbi:glycosyl transferase [Leptolyngbyaceae cyanobacterium CCMR0082]|uniref:Glycosyl transferase n=1 Tax=Adonisia turfae CCMR0082 TaxID=2304604 RepID=A0A6M0S6B9_9CYAN|nr:glycosyl transferase [Adonisia turfae]NEZ64014.1 glycosyl transferase [Adonisia turfae CCMR0082]
MKNLLFYSQPSHDIGHLIRSMAIVHSLTQEFRVYVVNSGGVIQDFPTLEGIEIVDLPITQTELSDSKLSVASLPIDNISDRRRKRLLELCDRIRPAAVIVERFPFEHHHLAAEIIPLLDRSKDYGAQTICSLGDIVISPTNKADYETETCQLINQYFDQILIHGDPSFISLNESFSCIRELTCDIHYTGYVVPDVDREFSPEAKTKPMILVTVGDGRLGHGLLDCVAQASQYLEDKIPHHIQIFTGPFVPMDIYRRLQAMAIHCSNLTVQRYTLDLLSYMVQADLAIGIAGYDMTLNVLQTGTRAMLLPFGGNVEPEQTRRLARLQERDILKIIEPEELDPILFSFETLAMLNRYPKPNDICLQGVKITTTLVKALVTLKKPFNLLNPTLEPLPCKDSY